MNPAALEEANRLLDGRAAGKSALFRIVVDEIVGHREDGYAFLVKGQSVPMRLHGEAVVASIQTRFRASNSAALSRVSKGTTLNVRGTVTKAALSSADRSMRFTVVLDEAQTQ